MYSVPLIPALASCLLMSAPVQAKIYDHVIAGAGTSGLLLAVELTKDPKIQVMVLEAGTDARSSPSVTVPEKEGSITGTQYDWAFKTIPQPGLPNSPNVQVARGKTIGGTSAMNWMIWNTASRQEYDAWSSVLHLTGWNWTALFSSGKAAQTFTAPTGDSAKYFSYDPQNYGTSGPVNASMPKTTFQLYTSYVLPALRSLGVSTSNNHDGGNNTGAGFTGLAIDSKSYTRSYSGSAYTAIQSRPNLQLLTSALVSQITWTPGSSPLNATGLAYQDTTTSPPTKRSIQARNVILSAGIQTPALLERSGVGNATSLKSLGITPVLSLPAVGAGLQDHMNVAGFFSISSSTPLNGSQYAQAFVDYAQPSRFLSASDHKRAAALLSPTAAPQGINPTAWKMVKTLFAADEPVIEFSWYQAFLTTYLLHPLSAGGVHASSPDPAAPPAINPAYNSAKLDGVSFDLWLLAKAVQYYATVLPQTAQLKKLNATYSIDPTLPFDQFSAKVAAGLKSGDHFTGGASLGDVVDAQLVVKGTRNVRVADLSVVPASPGAHPMGLAYAIAEKAAGLLRG